MIRHTFAVFCAAFTLSLLGAFSVLCVFYFPGLYALVYLWSLVCALLSSNERELPEYRLSRLAISVVFPFFSGVFLFIAKRRATKAEIAIIRGAEFDESRDTEALSLVDGAFSGTVKCLLSDDSTARLFSDTECKYFSDTALMLASMLSDISSSRRTVYLEYYIISEGRVFDELLERLGGCAARGVDVRIMFDDLGSMLRLSASLTERLRELGINVGIFSPLCPRIGKGNNRDHRKLLVIDSEIAYVGGMNLSDEYIGESKKFGAWRDMGVRLFGACATGFEQSFLALWEYCRHTGSLKPSTRASSGGERAEHCLKSSLFTPPGGGHFVSFQTAPKPFYPHSVGKRLFLNLLSVAKEYVYITTPYLIPDYELIEAMSRAVGRGVRVVIITPGIADKKIIKIITESFYPTLIADGVEIYEYPLGFLHGKIVSCDGKAAVVGSINLDYRSLHHNFENGVLMLDEGCVRAIEKDISAMLEVCEKINEKGKKHGIIKKTVRLVSGAILPIL